MSSPAQFRGARKGTRDAFQALLAVLAAGGATVAFEAFVGDVAPAWSGLAAVAFKVLIAYAQNYLETAGSIPVLLPTPGLVSAALDPVAGAVADTTPLVAPPAVATVDAVVDAAGEVTGEVVDTAGDIVGEVTGHILDDGERGGVGLVVAIVVAFLLVVGLFATCDRMINDESEPGDEHLGRVELVSHEYDEGGDQGYDQWNNEDRNRNRNRNRGAFSPGPFDDSPVDAFNGNTICLPGSTCYADDRNEPPPEEGEPA